MKYSLGEIGIVFLIVFLCCTFVFFIFDKRTPYDILENEVKEKIDNNEAYIEFNTMNLVGIYSLTDDHFKKLNTLLETNGYKLIRHESGPMYCYIKQSILDYILQMK